MPEPAEVSIALVRTGVDLKSLTARVRLGWNDGLVPEWVEVRNVAMSLFGGLVTSEGARYERSRAVSTPSVVLQGLKVQEILNLEQQKGLEGTGELDGVLPMTVSGGEVTIQNGVIEARPPGGVIRYRPSPESTEALAASNSQMNLVLQPLSNFHYNTLSARVQYAGDGTLKLETKLEGRNPDWQKGRPVHFNLNIEENIPALIKTLGIVQGIQESIENRFDSRDDR